jgi:hypothetical protein
MKRFIIAAGIAFLGLIGVTIAGLGWFAYTAVSAADANKAAAVDIVLDMSKSWTLNGIEHRLTSDALESVSTSAGQQAMRAMSQLGVLVKASEVTQTAYTVDLKSGTSATVTFQGQFENGAGNVTVVLREVGNEMKLLSFNLKETKARSIATRRDPV